MRSRLFPVVLTLCVCGLAVVPCRAADEENPFKKAAVGDWVSYKLTSEVLGQKTEAVVKMTVSAKDEKEATVKIVATADGKESPAQEQKFDLTKPFDPFTAGMPAGADVKVKKIEDGKETITVGKTKYACKWQTVKLTAKAPGQDKDMESEVKIWLCPDAPVNGIVKLEMKSEMVKLNMVMDDSGKGK